MATTVAAALVTAGCVQSPSPNSELGPSLPPSDPRVGTGLFYNQSDSPPAAGFWAQIHSERGGLCSAGVRATGDGRDASFRIWAEVANDVDFFFVSARDGPAVQAHGAGADTRDPAPGPKWWESIGIHGLELSPGPSQLLMFGFGLGDWNNTYTHGHSFGFVFVCEHPFRLTRVMESSRAVAFDLSSFHGGTGASARASSPANAQAAIERSGSVRFESVEDRVLVRGYVWGPAATGEIVYRSGGGEKTFEASPGLLISRDAGPGAHEIEATIAAVGGGFVGFMGELVEADPQLVDMAPGPFITDSP